MQTGTSINTIGLSIKFSDDKFVLLDCAGSESPVLGENTNIQNVSRDKLFTEAFLQSYIIKNSNAILLVVGNLTFSEQKLINKITEEIKNLNLRGKSQNLIIIHNLKTFETIAQVENYIANVLKKSATFNVQREESNFYNHNEFFYDGNHIKHFIYAKENSEAGKFYNKNAINNIKNLYTIETNKYIYDYKETIISHFKEMGQEMYDSKEKLNLDLEEVKSKKFKSSENENSKEIDNKINEDKNESYDKDSNNSTKEDNKNNNIKEDKIDENDNKKEYRSTLVYKGEDKLILKKMVIDELGVASFIKNGNSATLYYDYWIIKNGINPDYECYFTKKELVLNIECPEGVELTAKRKRNKNHNQRYLFAIEVEGTKKDDKPIEDATYIKKKTIRRLLSFNTISK